MSSSIQKGQQTHSDIKLKDRPGKAWAIVLLNDDVTPYAFVVALVMLTFNFSEQSAEVITHRVHTTGSAKIGSFSKQEAFQKRTIIIQSARNGGYPLQAKIVKDD